MAEEKGSFPTIIGADAVFKGELRFEKGVRLLGTFEGEIESKGELVIAQGAKLTGEVKADTISIDGDVRGNLSATSKVQLSSSAKLEGDVETARLEVADGAILVGRVSVGMNGQVTRPGGGKGVTTSAPTQTAQPAKPKPEQPVGVGVKK
jgi:cytoskeletal protein CcmA (bactofilin family)